MQIETKKISDLKGAPFNPRKITPAQMDALVESMKTFGYVEPVIWNKATGHIVGGHQRVRAMIQMGKTECEVVVIDIPLEKEKVLNIALNKISGEWDLPLLKDLMLDLDHSNMDLAGTGFSESEIEALMTAAAPPTIEDDEDGQTIEQVQVIKCPKCAHEFSILSKKEKDE